MFYGCIPDARDDRDHKFMAARDSLVLTDAHDLTAMFPPPVDQGGTGTCTCRGAPSAYRYNLLNTDQPDIELSAAQLYWDAGVLEGNTGDVGRQIRDVVKSLADKGIARASLWPDDRLGQEPTPDVYADALNQTILEYQRVEVNRRAINTAIYIGHPVIIGVPVFGGFEGDEAAETGIIPMPKRGETEVGWHCMLLGAYGPEGDTVLNSWGSWWGLPEKKGYCRLPAGYLEKYGQDFWTLFLDKKETPNV